MVVYDSRTEAEGTSPTIFVFFVGLVSGKKLPTDYSKAVNVC